MTIQQLCRENQIYKLKVIQLTKERQMLECDYNARLKADMVAILTEIQLEIEEIKIDEPLGFQHINKFYEGVSASSEVIQERINALRGGENE